MTDGTFNAAATAVGHKPDRFVAPRAVDALVSPSNVTAGGCGGSLRMIRRSHLARAMILAAFCLLAGCGAINPGKWKGIETTSADEHYYLVKEAVLTSGSAALPRENFDHNIHDLINLIFTLRNEKNTYVARSVWQDPNGQEFRTIRTTHDKQQEGKQGIDRSQKGATPRVHSIETQELYNHKPGIWKVSLYIDDELARRLTFSVR